MSAGGFRFETYACAGGDEWMLVRGPGTGPQILLLPPLFEELNFTRTLLADIGRRLAERGITSWLPDLPGTGESLRNLHDVNWQEWRGAVAATLAHIQARTGVVPLICAFRGGALLDDCHPSVRRWRFSPVTGESLLRQLRRAQQVGDQRPAAPPSQAQSGTVHLAGYSLSSAFCRELEEASPAPGAERELVAAPEQAIWRRSEPVSDPLLAQLLADDILEWARG